MPSSQRGTTLPLAVAGLLREKVTAFLRRVRQAPCENSVRDDPAWAVALPNIPAEGAGAGGIREELK
jgi:hypothetical protein